MVCLVIHASASNQHARLAEMARASAQQPMGNSLTDESTPVNLGLPPPLRGQTLSLAGPSARRSSVARFDRPLGGPPTAALPSSVARPSSSGIRGIPGSPSSPGARRVTRVKPICLRFLGLKNNWLCVRVPHASRSDPVQACPRNAHLVSSCFPSMPSIALFHATSRGDCNIATATSLKAGRATRAPPRASLGARVALWLVVAQDNQQWSLLGKMAQQGFGTDLLDRRQRYLLAIGHKDCKGLSCVLLIFFVGGATPEPPSRKRFNGK